MTGERLTVLVIGASGQIGQRVCRGLLGREVAVRGLTHSEEGATRLTALGVNDVVRADLAVPETLPEPFRGVDRVMQITRALREPQQELNAAAAAEEASVDRIVKLSSDILYYHWDGAGDSDKASPRDMVSRLHGPAEDRILATGVDSVMLRPTWFMSIDANPIVAAGFRSGQFVWPAGPSGLALVHPDDVAEAAVACLTADTVPDSPVHLTGPEELSPDQIAAGFAEARGAEIVAVRPSLEEYEDWLEEVAGMPRQARHIIEPYAARTRAPVSDGIERLLGRRATSFAEYLAGEVS